MWNVVQKLFLKYDIDEPVIKDGGKEFHIHILLGTNE